MTPQSFYDQVASELMAGPPHPGLWARAYALADGDMDIARARYIALRVEQLEAEFGVEEERRQEREKHEHKRVLQQRATDQEALAERHDREYKEAQARLPWHKRDDTLVVVLASVVFVILGAIILSIRANA